MPRLIRSYKWVFDDVELGIRIRDARQASGMTQLELAILCSFESSAVISALENGRYTEGITVRSLLKLTNWLDVDPCVCFAIQLEDV